MGSKQLLFITLIFLIAGCRGPVNQLDGTDTIPNTFENPLERHGPPPADEPIPSTKPTAPVITEEPEPTTERKLPEVSDFIRDAEWVMIKEGKKIGTPCNFYLRRVLVVSGFADEGFLANDFDVYAKKNLKHATVVIFKNDGKGSEEDRLKRHLWSFPERTPFIMQWSRTGVRGHVAIVERVNEKLIIYQANLGKHTARKDQTTIDKLLSGFNRRMLSVYSDF